jgi:phosphatidylserine decarboxylase
VNRAPISGIVGMIKYSQSKNAPMTAMWWRVLLGMKPYELYSDHVLQNERNTILFKGKISVFIVQIADIFVNKIECWVKEGESVSKGQRVGMIKMGSQVDLLFPSDPVLDIVVKVGQKVKAGETIIASLK